MNNLCQQQKLSAKAGLLAVDEVEAAVLFVGGSRDRALVGIGHHSDVKRSEIT
jgi:hypothetical protein